MKKSLLAALATLPLFLNACVVNMDWETGNGVAVTETRHLPAFSRIQADAPIDVIVKQGPAYRAYVTGDANLVAYYETEAFAGTLTISQSYGLDPVIVPQITIEVPDLRSVVHDGMGVVEILDDHHFSNLNLTLNGSGEIHFSGTATNLTTVVNGSGRIFAEGYADYVKAEMRGFGEISAEYLLAGDADVVLSGAGNVYLDLDYGSVLNLDLSGSGRLEWWGAPLKVDYHISGTGKVLEHRVSPRKIAAAKPSAKAAANADAGKTYEIAPKGTGLKKK
jgi:hypothetical protein